MKITVGKASLFILLLITALLCLVLAYPVYCRYFEDHDRLLSEAYLPMKSSNVVYDSEDSSAVLYNVTLSRDGKRDLECMMRIPKSEPPYAIMVLLGGLRTGKNAVRYIDSSGRSQEFIFISLDYPYSGNKDRIPPMEVIKTVPEIRNAILDTHGAVSTIIDFALTLSGIDQNKVFVTGVSFGSFFAVSAGSGDARVKGVASLYGGGNLRRLITANLKFNPKILRTISGYLASMMLRPVEPLERVRDISPRHFLIINGTGDARIPELSATELYEAAGEPKKLVWLGSEHFDKAQTELTQMLIGLVGDWLAESGLIE